MREYSGYIRFTACAGFIFKENVRYPVWPCRDPISSGLLWPFW